MDEVAAELAGVPAQAAARTRAGVGRVVVAVSINAACILPSFLLEAMSHEIRG